MDSCLPSSLDVKVPRFIGGHYCQQLLSGLPAPGIYMGHCSGVGAGHLQDAALALGGGSPYRLRRGLTGSPGQAVAGACPAFSGLGPTGGRKYRVPPPAGHLGTRRPAGLNRGRLAN